MEFIGSIIKESTRFTPIEETITQLERPTQAIQQQKALEKLLSKAKFTDFGIIHKFIDALDADDPIACFQENVPITDYNTFHEQWLHKAIDGSPHVIWPGLIKYYALSSGTSGSRSKRIPVTNSMIRQFQKTTYKQIAGLRNLDLPTSFYQTKVLIVGGSTQLNKYGQHHYEGDLSGILAKNKSIVYSPFSRPKKNISQITDWNEKIERMVEKAPKWNVGTISGVPSWVALLMEKIIERYKLNTIHDIWPNLKIYLHGGVFLEPYLERLEKLFGEPVHYLNTYLASEGYFGFQKRPNDEGIRLLINAGVFYEFVEEKYFEQLKNKDFYDIPTLTIDQVEPNKRYSMVISTCSGLWRYSLEDIIEFTNHTCRNIRIVGRLSHTLNTCGEHLSETNMTTAIHETAKILRVSAEEFCVYPSRDFDRHLWYIGTNQRINANQFAAVLNERLEMKNADYACVRKHLLKAPKVKILPNEKFFEFMLYNNKIGSQNKFPRVMNAKQASNWETFLTNIESYRLAQ